MAFLITWKQLFVSVFSTVIVSVHFIVCSAQLNIIRGTFYSISIIIFMLNNSEIIAEVKKHFFFTQPVI